MWGELFWVFVSMFVGAFYICETNNQQGSSPIYKQKHSIQGGKSGSLTMMVRIIEQSFIIHCSTDLRCTGEMDAVWLYESRCRMEKNNKKKKKSL